MKQNSLFGVTDEGFYRLVYSEWGTFNPHYPAVVCVHGMTRNRHDFDFLARYLSDNGRHVFSVDMAGRGDSDWFKSPTHYNFKQYVADTNVLIEKTGSQSIDFIGTSMGGLIGMMIASLPNNRINRLIMNDIGPQIPLKGLQRLASYAGTNPYFRSIEQAVDYYKNVYADFGHLTDAQWRFLTEHSIKQIKNGDYIPKVDPAISKVKSKAQWFKELLQNPRQALTGILFDVDLWSFWQQITCPVLVIHGQNSDLLLQSCITKMQQTHPQTEVYQVTDAGHAPALFAPEQYIKVFDWLTVR